MDTLIVSLVLLGPGLLILTGLSPSTWADRHPRFMEKASSVAAKTALLGAVTGSLLYAASSEGPIELGWGPLDLHIDALTTIMLPLVGLIGAVVVCYSRNYLRGDPGQGHFFKWMTLTLGAVLALIVSGNLLLLAAAWICTSLALHQLLVFYPERKGAQVAARKKFLVSRAGDACLLAAIVLIYDLFGTLRLSEIFTDSAILAEMYSPGELYLHFPQISWMGGCLVAAALLKSAQFPFHSWLPEVMETPTPVSAMMHAGVINAGGFLVVRMSPLLALAPDVLSVLALVGAVTALFGSMAMLTQTSIKRSLAFSTIGQMGFMMLQCGLGAFSSATLHIVAHALYKAHAFLSSGSIVDMARAAWTPPVQAARHPAHLCLALLAAAGMTYLVAGWFGFTLESHHGILVLGFILMAALTYLIWNSMQGSPGWALRGRGVALAFVACVGYFAMQAAFVAALDQVLPVEPSEISPFEAVLMAGVVLLFMGVLLLQVRFPGVHGDRAWQTAYVHLYNGLYISTLANRCIRKVWPPALDRQTKQ